MPHGDTRMQKAEIMNKEKTVVFSLLCYHGQQGRGPYLAVVTVGSRGKDTRKKSDRLESGAPQGFLHNIPLNFKVFTFLK